MSYATISARLVSLLEGATGYSSDNVALDDYTVMNSGQETGIVVMFSTVLTRDHAMGGEIERLWQFKIRHYTRTRTDLSATINAQSTERQAIIDLLESYPTLNKLAGVLIAGRLEALTPVIDQIELGGHSYMIEEFNTTVTEIVTVTEAE